MKLISRIKLRLAKVVATLYARLLPSLRRVEDWLYRQDITRRRVKRVLRWVGLGVLLLLLSTLAVFVLYVLTTPGFAAFATNMVNLLIQALVRLVAPFKMVDPSELVTIIAATIVVSIGAAITGFIRGPRKAPSLPSPLIVIRDGGSYYHKESDSIVHTLVVSNYGETAALACQARITFTDIEQRDIVDVAGMSVKFTRENFKSTIKSELRWNTGSKEVPIRSGDDAELEVLRIVPAKNGVIEHFEVPSDEGWQSITVILEPHRYYGEVRVVPLNGKFRATSFEIRPDKDKKRWIISVL